MLDPDEVIKAIIAALGGSPGEAQQKDPAPDPATAITAANKSLRDTAKWILTSFAAVGAIVVGGLQLSSIGNWTDETPDARVLAGLVGIALTALGVAIAIWFMSAVLQPALNSFRSADKDTKAADRAIAEPLRMTYADLKKSVYDAEQAVHDAEKAFGKDSDQYKEAAASRARWMDARKAGLTFIGTELLWSRYERAKKATVLATFLVLGGVVAFAWGANPPESDTEDPAVVLAEAPVPLNVQLTDAGVMALEDARGCDRADLRALTVGGEEGKREMVTVPTRRCRSVRFVLTSGLGTATAAGIPR